jgi:hypothetical protein
VVAIKDDLISAMRYATLSVERFGEKATGSTTYKKYNFDAKIEYNNRGVV